MSKFQKGIYVREVKLYQPWMDILLIHFAWLIVALFLVAVAGAYLVNAIKNRGTTYVVNMNNVVVKYDENAIKSEIANVPNEMKKWY